MNIRQNLEKIQEKIRQAAQRGGRKPSEVQLLGVTKFATEAEIQELIEAGLTVLGENRVQQGVTRVARFPVAQWHFIGNLQTNKVKYCREFALIHSLERWRLAQEINKRAGQWGKIQNVLVQVNTAGEESKSGLSPSQVKDFIRKVNAECPNLKIRGLMMMAPLIVPEQTRPYFRETRALYDRLQAELSLNWDILSMGSTNDYIVAIEEGATLVRIGSALFAKEGQDE